MDMNTKLLNELPPAPLHSKNFASEHDEHQQIQQRHRHDEPILSCSSPPQSPAAVTASTQQQHLLQAPQQSLQQQQHQAYGSPTISSTTTTTSSAALNISTGDFGGKAALFPGYPNIIVQTSLLPSSQMPLVIDDSEQHSTMRRQRRCDQQHNKPQAPPLTSCQIQSSLKADSQHTQQQRETTLSSSPAGARSDKDSRGSGSRSNSGHIRGGDGENATLSSNGDDNDEGVASAAAAASSMSVLSAKNNSTVKNSARQQSNLHQNSLQRRKQSYPTRCASTDPALSLTTRTSIAAAPDNTTISPFLLQRLENAARTAFVGLPQFASNIPTSSSSSSLLFSLPSTLADDNNKARATTATTSAWCNLCNRNLSTNTYLRTHLAVKHGIGQVPENYYNKKGNPINAHLRCDTGEQRLLQQHHSAEVSQQTLVEPNIVVSLVEPKPAAQQQLTSLSSTPLLVPKTEQQQEVNGNISASSGSNNTIKDDKNITVPTESRKRANQRARQQRHRARHNNNSNNNTGDNPESASASSCSANNDSLQQQDVINNSTLLASLVAKPNFLATLTPNVKALLAQLVAGNAAAAAQQQPNLISSAINNSNSSTPAASSATPTISNGAPATALSGPRTTPSQQQQPTAATAVVAVNGSSLAPLLASLLSNMNPNLLATLQQQQQQQQAVKNQLQPLQQFSNNNSTRPLLPFSLQNNNLLSQLPVVSSSAAPQQLDMSAVSRLQALLSAVTASSSAQTIPVMLPPPPPPQAAIGNDSNSVPTANAMPLLPLLGMDSKIPLEAILERVRHMTAIAAAQQQLRNQQQQQQHDNINLSLPVSCRSNNSNESSSVGKQQTTPLSLEQQQQQQQQLILPPWLTNHLPPHMWPNSSLPGGGFMLPQPPGSMAMLQQQLPPPMWLNPHLMGPLPPMLPPPPGIAFSTASQLPHEISMSMTSNLSTFANNNNRFPFQVSIPSGSVGPLPPFPPINGPLHDLQRLLLLQSQSNQLQQMQPGTVASNQNNNNGINDANDTHQSTPRSSLPPASLFRCRDCNNDFPSKQLLTLHKQSAHNIFFHNSSSPESVLERSFAELSSKQQPKLGGSSNDNGSSNSTRGNTASSPFSELDGEDNRQQPIGDDGGSSQPGGSGSNNNNKKRRRINTKQSAANADGMTKRVVDPFRVDPEAFCEICRVEVCSKYFLKTHKANLHHVPLEQQNTQAVKQERERVLDEMRYAAQVRVNAERLKHAAVLGNVDMTNAAQLASLAAALPPQPEIPHSAKNFCNICHKELCNKYFAITHMRKMHNIEIEEEPGRRRKRGNGGAGGSKKHRQQQLSGDNNDTTASMATSSSLATATSTMHIDMPDVSTSLHHHQQDSGGIGVGIGADEEDDNTEDDNDEYDDNCQINEEEQTGQQLSRSNNDNIAHASSTSHDDNTPIVMHASTNEPMLTTMSSTSNQISTLALVPAIVAAPSACQESHRIPFANEVINAASPRNLHQHAPSSPPNFSNCSAYVQSVNSQQQDLVTTQHQPSSNISRLDAQQVVQEQLLNANKMLTSFWNHPRSTDVVQGNSLLASNITNRKIEHAPILSENYEKNDNEILLLRNSETCLLPSTLSPSSSASMPSSAANNNSNAAAAAAFITNESQNFLLKLLPTLPAENCGVSQASEHHGGPELLLSLTNALTDIVRGSTTARGGQDEQQQQLVIRLPVRAEFAQPLLSSLLLIPTSGAEKSSM